MDVSDDVNSCVCSGRFTPHLSPIEPRTPRPPAEAGTSQINWKELNLRRRRCEDLQVRKSWRTAKNRGEPTAELYELSKRAEACRTEIELSQLYAVQCLRDEKAANLPSILESTKFKS